MSPPVSRPGRVPVAVRLAAVVVAAVTVAGTLLTWRTTFSPTAGPTGHPAWTSGVWSATGATLAVVGVVVLLVSTFVVRAGARLVAGGAVFAVAGVVTLLAERYHPAGPSGLMPVTVAIARFSVGPAQGVAALPGTLAGALPDATAWVTAGGLGALVVAAAAFPVRTSRAATRSVTVIAVVGAALLVVGASAFPWSFGGSGSVTVTLWGSGHGGVIGAVLLLLAVGPVAVTAWRPLRGLAVTAGLLAAGGLGLLLPQRLPNPWGDRVVGFASYQPLESIELPAAWRFHAATTLVLLGALLILVAATLAARRTPTSDPVAV